jgi:transposase
MHEMSTEVRELKVIPAQISVVEHARYVYSCRQSQNEKEELPPP